MIVRGFWKILAKFRLQMNSIEVAELIVSIPCTSERGLARYRGEN
jgi:hypothetical protein